jgi:cytochrome c5
MLPPPKDFMSDSNDYEGQHDSPIKTPKQLIWTVIAAFVLPVLIIVLLVNYVAYGDQPAAGSDGLSEQAIAMRIQPVGVVDFKDVNDLASLKTGEQVYTVQCSACHASGVANAPKLGDEAAWAARLKAGYAALLNSALKGKGAMPPQGGELSDLEIGRAVVFLANRSGAKFDEPKAPVAAASAAPAASAVASGN